eukprot:m.197454 g.197454  ORF g.197454 m.197454 type:complete len:898 (+) comp15278_c0_seq3:312-3005(+)
MSSVGGVLEGGKSESTPRRQSSVSDYGGFDDVDDEALDVLPPMRRSSVYDGFEDGTDDNVEEVVGATAAGRVALGVQHSALVKATDEMAREKVEGLEAPPPPYPSLKGRRRFYQTTPVLGTCRVGIEKVWELVQRLAGTRAPRLTTREAWPLLREALKKRGVRRGARAPQHIKTASPMVSFLLESGAGLDAADVWVTHSWDASFSGLIEAVVARDKLCYRTAGAPPVRYHIDVVCGNPEEARETSEWWEVRASAIKSVYEVLLVLPTGCGVEHPTLNRAWILYEIGMAMQASTLVRMAVTRELSERIVAEPGLLGSLLAVDLERAGCTEAHDKRMIVAKLCTPCNPPPDHAVDPGRRLPHTASSHDPPEPLPGSQRGSEPGNGSGNGSGGVRSESDGASVSPGRSRGAEELLDAGWVSRHIGAQLLANFVEQSSEERKGKGTFGSLLAGLSSVLCDGGSLSDAVACGRTALLHHKTAFGVEDYRVGRVWNTLAVAFTGLNEVNDALLAARCAATVLANCPSTPAFPEAARIRELARVRLLLGNLWLSARRPVLADVCFSIAASGTAAAAVAVDTQSEHTAEETEIVRLHTNALGGVGFSRRWFGDREGAVTVYREALQLRAAHRLPEGSDTVRFLCGYGHACLDAGLTGAANAVLDDARAISRRIAGGVARCVAALDARVTRIAAGKVTPVRDTAGSTAQSNTSSPELSMEALRLQLESGSEAPGAAIGLAASVDEGDSGANGEGMERGGEKGTAAQEALDEVKAGNERSDSGAEISEEDGAPNVYDEVGDYASPSSIAMNTATHDSQQSDVTPPQDTMSMSTTDAIANDQVPTDVDAAHIVDEGQGTNQTSVESETPPTADPIVKDDGGGRASGSSGSDSPLPMLPQSSSEDDTPV